MFGFRKKDGPDAGPPPKAPVDCTSGSVSLTGMALEDEVRRIAGMSLDWELPDLQPLLVRLSKLHYTVSLHTCRTGWACDITIGEVIGAGFGHFVREYSDESPSVAAARAGIAAAREWPSAE